MNACKCVILNRAGVRHGLKLVLGTNSLRTISAINSRKSHRDGKSFNKNTHTASSFIAIAGLIGFGYYKLKHSLQVDCENPKEAEIETGSFIKGLPEFTPEQVAQHGKNSDTIWVSYKNGVYDITEFIESHPGGNKIMWGAGKPLEPFWEIYAVHKHKDVLEILEAYRIGNLIVDEKKTSEKGSTSDPFASDPERHPLLTVLTRKPFNAETPKQFSADHLITPNELFFVRNHLPVPHVDKKTFRLEIVDAENNRSISLSLDDLESSKLPVYTIPVTIQCSGNKRKFMNMVEPVQGLMWDVNAISNAQWTGVLLKDLLKHAGMNLENEKIKHVQFEGLDKDPTGSPYGASIPKEKVLSDLGDVLIAFKMNGQDIPVDHGFPLRVVVPGVVGARSVKWLNKIVLSGSESKSHWQINDYKILSPSVKNLKDADFTRIKAIQECNVQSGICEPVEGAVFKREETKSIKIKGYAYSGGGNDIDRVVVSIDGGRTWNEAKLKKLDNRPLYKCWSWTLWELELELPTEKSANFEIICVATDSNGNTQPESVKSIWNARGLMNNSWHKVNVKLN